MKENSKSEIEKQAEEKKCSTHCDWPNCTLGGCRQKEIDSEDVTKGAEEEAKKYAHGNFDHPKNKWHGVYEAFLAGNSYASLQRQQARKLVFENNKPVADHVNETFEGLNKLTDDTEIVWWYKELIVQTVLHFTLQEREKAIDECLQKLLSLSFRSDKQFSVLDCIEELEKLKR